MPNESGHEVGDDAAERLLSRGEAARYLGVTVTTIYHWARTGRLPYKVTLGGHLRFAKSDLDAADATRERRRSRGFSPSPARTVHE